MKIAIDIREASQGKTGKGQYTYNIVRELLKMDHKNEYVLYTDSSQNPFDEAKNAQVKLVNEKSWKWHWKVLHDLKTEKPDIFFAPTSYIIPAFAPKSLKTVITIYDLVAFLFPASHNFKAVLVERVTLRMSVKKAKKILVISQNTKKDFLERFKYNERNIHMTTCGLSDFFNDPVDPNELHRFKEKLQLPQNFILAVGTLEPRKNFGTLIKSFVIIKRKFPDYKLVIVGKKGWKYKHIDEILKKYELQNDVVFPGYIADQDLKKMYMLATVFVFPSLYEGFGIPPLEAMACGCPVVSSNVSSLPEVVGDAGILIQPKNALKLAEAVCSLINNDQVRSMLIERGKLRVQKFTWKNSAKIALETFEEMVK